MQKVANSNCGVTASKYLNANLVLSSNLWEQFNLKISMQKLFYFIKLLNSFYSKKIDLFLRYFAQMSKKNLKRDEL